MDTAVECGFPAVQGEGDLLCGLCSLPDAEGARRCVLGSLHCPLRDNDRGWLSFELRIAYDAGIGKVLSKGFGSQIWAILSYYCAVSTRLFGLNVDWNAGLGRRFNAALSIYVLVGIGLFPQFLCNNLKFYGYWCVQMGVISEIDEMLKIRNVRLFSVLLQFLTFMVSCQDKKRVTMGCLSVYAFF